MPVVINEFEVVPEPPKKDNPAAKKDEKGASEQPPTDYEVKRMIERRAERSERISAH